jgi:hypothetical protein
MKVLGTDHVQMAMSKGSEDRARGFYGEGLGMKEMTKRWPDAAIAGSPREWRRCTSGLRTPPWSPKDWTRFSRNAKPLRLPTRPDAERDGRRVHVFEPFGSRLERMKLETTEPG